MGILKTNKSKDTTKRGGVKFEVSTTASSNQDKSKLRSKRNQGRGMDLYDFVNLRKNKSVIKLIKNQGEDYRVKMYSDPVTRINSNFERKLRICVITDKTLYILYTKSKNGSYKLKYLTPLSLITKLTICRKNSTLIKISIKNM